MKLNDWLTLAAIVLGPIFAVSITLFIEEFSRTRARRLHILRMLLATRHMPADAQYNIAINLIPAEFNDQTDVMDAWRSYHRVVRERPTQEMKAEHQNRMNVAQATMIYRIMLSAGLKATEGEIQTEVYISQGYLDRDALYIASLKAMPEIAEAMKTQVTNTQELLRLARGNRPGAIPAEGRVGPSG